MVVPKYMNSSTISKELPSVFIMTLSYMETNSTWKKNVPQDQSVYHKSHIK